MTKLRVIFVHGMSSHLLAEKNMPATYFIGLRNALIQRLKEMNVVPPDAAEGDEIGDIITFDHVHYSDIGQREEDAVLKVYREASQHLFSFLDHMVAKALDHVRLQMVTAFSDVLVYRSDHWRDEIRKRLFEKVNPHIDSGEAITIVAHSLGTPVAFDTVYHHVNDGEWKGRGFKLANLFVMGSPIALFAMEPIPSTEGALEDSPGDGEESPVRWENLLQVNASPPAEVDFDPTALTDVPSGIDPRLSIVADSGVLYNFLDAQDLIAYPLEAFFKDKVTYEVEDIAVGNGLDPITAHSKYWDNNEVADRIAERLKQDFERQ